MRSEGAKTRVVLTIAGSDPSAGAGIQADLKTIAAFGLYGMSAVTALTVQNTQGVKKVVPVEPETVAQQLDAVFTDVMPASVKIGMLANKEIVEVVAEKLKQYQPKLVVLDPILLSTSGHELLDEGGRRAMVEMLFPLVTVLTPNLPEAEALVNADAGQKPVDRKELAERISRLFGDELDKKHAILIKGGHMQGKEAEDYLYWFCHFSGRREDSMVVPKDTEGRKVVEFTFASPRLEHVNTHGTGCTLSSAIACGLAKGRSVETSVRDAKEYINGAIGHGLSIGKGIGPLDHFWNVPIS